MASLLNLISNVNTIQVAIDADQPVLLCGERMQWDNLKAETKADLKENNVVVLHVTKSAGLQPEAQRTGLNLTGHARRVLTQEEADEAERRGLTPEEYDAETR